MAPRAWSVAIDLRCPAAACQPCRGKVSGQGGPVGRRATIPLLGIASVASDEAKLKALRRRILQRNSDEAFHDYQRVNEAILRNRMVAKLQVAP